MIPKIQRETFDVVVREVCPDKLLKLWDRLKEEQPELIEYLMVSKLSIPTLVNMLVVYRLIETQIEVNDLEELYDS